MALVAALAFDRQVLGASTGPDYIDHRVSALRRLHQPGCDWANARPPAYHPQAIVGMADRERCGAPGPRRPRGISPLDVGVAGAGFGGAGFIVRQTAGGNFPGCAVPDPLA